MSAVIVPCTIPAWVAIDGEVHPVIAWHIDPALDDFRAAVKPITKWGFEPTAEPDQIASSQEEAETVAWRQRGPKT